MLQSKAHILAKLLLNHHIKDEVFNNIDANLYYIYSREKQKALKINTTRDRDIYCLNLSAVSIMSYLTYKKWHKSPIVQYKRHNSILLRVIKKSDLNSNENLVFKATNFEKVNIDYLCLNDKFSKSKLGILYKILNRLECSDMAKYFKLEFKSYITKNYGSK